MYDWTRDMVMLTALNTDLATRGTTRAPDRTAQAAAALGLTAQQLADLRRTAYARLRHPNRRWSPRAPRPATKAA